MNNLPYAERPEGFRKSSLYNSTGKFLISALLVHAANLKKAGETQSAIPVPQTLIPSNSSHPAPAVNAK